MAKDASGEHQRAGRNWTEVARDVDLRGWLRLSGWGIAALAALFLALAAALSGSGSQRLIAAAAQGDEAAPLTPAELTARAAAADQALRHLNDAVRRLTAERAETAARVAALERSLDDLTGSIKGTARAEAPPAAPSPAPPSPAASASAAPPEASAGAPQSVAASSAPASVAIASVPQPTPRPSAAASDTAAPTANAGQPAEGAEGAEGAKPRTAGDLGVDVGGAVNFEGLRVLWASTREHNPALFEGLFPIVAVRESSKTHNAELRLVVGPLAGADAAGRICAALTTARRYCQPVAFEGQRLLLAESVPERSSAPAPGRKRAAAAERKPKEK